MPIDRPISFRLPLTSAEHRALRKLAKASGTPATAYIRSLIRREFTILEDMNQVPTKAAPPRKRKTP